MNLQEHISRIQSMMGLLNEEKPFNRIVEIFPYGSGSEFADEYVGPIQKIPVKDTLSNEPFKDTSYMETSDIIKNMIQSINDGEELPPIRVIQHPYDKTKYNVVDGNHRRYAFSKSNVDYINAIVIPITNVVLMKSEWGDDNKDYIKLSDVLDNKKLIDKYFVKPNETNDFEQPSIMGK
jgi:ParB-like chromosome segregation protein Spo0J